jgi:hypothetical protein
MRNILPLLLIGTLIFSGFEVIASDESNFLKNKICESIDISDLIFNQDREENSVKVESKNFFSYLIKSGEPMLPVINRQYEFPLRTKINNVDVDFINIKEKEINLEINIAPTPVLTLLNQEKTIEKICETNPESVKNNLNISTNFSYNLHTGFNGKERILILNLRCFPVKYNTTEDKFYSPDSIDINIKYELPRNQLSYPKIYDMVIIAPKNFIRELKPLMEHKNEIGINTTYKTVEEIYKEYSGRDKPEKIKYYLKDCIENYGIKYVILVGGLKSQIWAKPRDDDNQGSRFWHLPVRYTNLKETSAVYDPGYISDLYFADVYKVENQEVVFDDWDSNKNNIFAEWEGTNVDIIDFYPDIYVGRLACRNAIEVKTVVNKIIKYEQSTPDSSWFNRMVVVGGDSHYDPSTDYLEGELVCEKSISYMIDFQSTKLYSSNRVNNNGLTPTPFNISKEISKGAGFLIFDGHGNPGSWDTHWYGEYTWEKTPGGISIYKFPFLSNKQKLPITIIGGCHNSQINVSLLPTLLKKPYMWTYGMPVPECFSWWLVRKIGGGSIATLGSTGLGYGYVGNHNDLDGDGVDEPDAVEGLGGYITTTFFKSYSEGANILGQTWGNTINNYLNIFQPMDDKIQMKCIQEWILLGDPSLKIGGYNN